MGTVADDDRIDLGCMAILRSEAFGHFLDEVVVALFLDEVDGTTAEATAHDAGSRPDFVIAYPKKYKSYNFSRQECKKQGFSRIGGRACYFTRLFARLPKQQKQPLIIKHLQTYFEKVTKSGGEP